MDIKYLGLSSFRISGKTTSIVTDPYDPKMVGLKFPKVSAEIVCVTHDHGDHNQVQLVDDVRKVVNGPGEYEISGVSILGMPSFHDDKRGAERGKNTIYSIEVDKVNICHLGDLGHKLTEKEVEKIGDVDVLMIPVGGEYTINSDQAVELVRSIEPKIILPMHFFADGMNSEVFGKLSKVDEFVNDLGIKVEKDKKLVIKAGQIPEEQFVFLFEN